MSILFLYFLWQICKVLSSDDFCVMLGQCFKIHKLLHIFRKRHRCDSKTGRLPRHWSEFKQVLTFLCVWQVKLTNMSRFASNNVMTHDYDCRALFQYLIRRRIVRSCKTSKMRDRVLKLDLQQGIIQSFHGLHMSHYSLVVFLYIKKHQYSTCILIFGQWPKSMSVSCPSFHFNFHTLQVFLNSIVNVICCPGYRGSRGGITVVAAADFGDGNNENYLEINVN